MTQPADRRLITEAAGNATYASSLPARSWAHHIEQWPSGEPMPRLVDSRGIVWGAEGSNVHTSPTGDAWTFAFTTTGIGSVQAIKECQDGGLIVFGSSGVSRVSDPTGTPVVTQKVTAQTNTQINAFNACGDTASGKFGCTEYGPGGAEAWIASRYGHISVDDGHTWAVRWDSDTMTSPLNAPSEAHVHGMAYDPWEGAWYVCEGHGPGVGIYRSDDDGVTWTKPAGMQGENPSPTVLVPTVDGLVAGMDSKWAGLTGIPRSGPVEERRMARTWAWRSPDWDGVIGFGRDYAVDEFGTVFVCFNASHAETRPVIAGGSATGGTLVWEWPVPTAERSLIDKICLLPDGRLIARAVIDSVVQKVTLWPSRDRAPSTVDHGNVSGATAEANTSVAAGFGAVADINDMSGAPATRAVVIGAGARTIADDSITIGRSAFSNGAGTILIGSGSSATGSNSVGIGRDLDLGSASQAVVVGSSTSAVAHGAIIVGTGVTAGSGGTGVVAATAIGANVTLSGGNSVGIGYTASAGSSSIAVGRSADASGNNAVAVGREAVSVGASVAVGRGANASASAVAVGDLATVTAARSVALGKDTTVAVTDQVGIGPRSWSALNVTSAPATVTGGGVLYFEAGALKCKGGAGTVTVVAPA